MSEPLKIRFSIEPWTPDKSEPPKRIVLEKFIEPEHFNEAFDDFIVCVKQALKPKDL